MFTLAHWAHGANQAAAMTERDSALTNLQATVTLLINPINVVMFLRAER